MRDVKQKPINGTTSTVDGKPCVFYDGYWIRKYDPPTDEVAARRELIDQLTKRVFHHTEPGINTPGYNLDEARQAYELENEPDKKRVNAAMLAGALLHRGSDIFSIIFQLDQRGIEIDSANELMRECESCLLEAFDLGKQVKHYSGEEGLDELWGEPLKAFYTPIAEFYESRYLKIAQTMAVIDKICQKMTATFCDLEGFESLGNLVEDYARTAKIESETIKTDPAIFKVWPEFVVAGDSLQKFTPQGTRLSTTELQQGRELLHAGKRLIEWVAFARVPMPKTTTEYFQRCSSFKNNLT